MDSELEIGFCCGNEMGWDGMGWDERYASGINTCFFLDRGLVGGKKERKIMVFFCAVLCCVVLCCAGWMCSGCVVDR